MITRVRNWTAAQLQVVLTTFHNRLSQTMIKPNSSSGHLHMLPECHQPWAREMIYRIFAGVTSFATKK